MIILDTVGIYPVIPRKKYLSYFFQVWMRRRFTSDNLARLTCSCLRSSRDDGGLSRGGLRTRIV